MHKTVIKNYFVYDSKNDFIGHNVFNANPIIYFKFIESDSQISVDNFL